jgi:hypothetical protein
MPHFTVPLSPDGYALDVMVGLRASDMAALQAAGQPIPPPLRARALLDTGTDMTAVAASLLRQLGIGSHADARTHTVGGLVKVDLYWVSLSVLSPSGGITTAQARPEWLVTDFQHAPPNVDVLLGLDVARESLLILDGPGKLFTFAF